MFFVVSCNKLYVHTKYMYLCNPAYAAMYECTIRSSIKTVFIGGKSTVEYAIHARALPPYVYTVLDLEEFSRVASPYMYLGLASPYKCNMCIITLGRSP